MEAVITRFYQSLKGPLKIYEVNNGWIIGIKYVSVAGATIHNCVHNDDYMFVVYPSLEAAKEAAKTIMELRQIPLARRIVVE